MWKTLTLYKKKRREADKKKGIEAKMKSTLSRNRLKEYKKTGYPRIVRVRGLPKITWGKELTCPFFVPNFLGFRIIL